MKIQIKQAEQADKILNIIKNLYQAEESLDEIANYLNEQGYIRSDLYHSQKSHPTGLFDKNIISRIAREALGRRRKINHTKAREPGQKQEPELAPPVPQVIQKDNKFYTSSKNIAEVTGIRHDNILRDIKNLKCSEKFLLLNFEESFYLNSQNKSQPMFLITRDGAAGLIMSYATPRAWEFKEMYIEKFNELEARLKKQEPEILTEIQILQRSIKLLADMQERQQITEARLDKIDRAMAQGRDRLNQVEVSNILPFEATTRAKIENLVKAYALAYNIPFPEVWNKCYHQFYIRYRIDVFKRAKNRNISKLDCIQLAGMMEEFFNLVSHLLKINNQEDKK